MATGAAAAGCLLAVGLFGAALLYGDGMITPAISVLSAVEGLQISIPVFVELAVPVTIGILIALFLVQRQGTAVVGQFFGPVMVLWFPVLATTGVAGIVREPGVLAAVNPWHGIDFLPRNRLHGYFVLGSVFLTVTGAEALYADLGHFGANMVKITHGAWFPLAIGLLIFIVMRTWKQGRRYVLSALNERSQPRSEFLATRRQHPRCGWRARRSYWPATRPERKVGLSLWRANLFTFLSRNAVGATDFYHIPPDQVMEVGSQVKV